MSAVTGEKEEMTKCQKHKSKCTWIKESGKKHPNNRLTLASRPEKGENHSRDVSLAFTVHICACTVHVQ